MKPRALNLCTRQEHVRGHSRARGPCPQHIDAEPSFRAASWAPWGQLSQVRRGWDAPPAPLLVHAAGLPRTPLPLVWQETTGALHGGGCAKCNIPGFYIQFLKLHLFGCAGSSLQHAGSVAPCRPAAAAHARTLMDSMVVAGWLSGSVAPGITGPPTGIKAVSPALQSRI